MVLNKSPGHDNTTNKDDCLYTTPRSLPNLFEGGFLNPEEKPPARGGKFRVWYTWSILNL